VGRFLNIIPLSWLANRCRSGHNKIPIQMQAVLCLAGLRGAIAFALSENMPGPHKETYATATLSICIFTTVVLGGFTEQLLTVFGMKDAPHPLSLQDDSDDGERWHLNRLTYTPPPSDAPRPRRTVVAEMARRRMYEGVKGLWKRIDDELLKPNFGGSSQGATTRGLPTATTRNTNDHLGNYELGAILTNSDSDDDDGE
jgi:solute carrier family 9 (sodium/hydrogen exchanger), member 8